MTAHTNSWSSGARTICPSQALFYELRRAVLAHRTVATSARLHSQTRLSDCLAADRAHLIRPLLRQKLEADELPVEDRVFVVPVLEMGATWLALWFPCFLYWLVVCGDPGIPRFVVLPGFVLPPALIAGLVGWLSRPTWIGVRTLGDLTRWLLRHNENVVEPLRAAETEQGDRTARHGTEGRSEALSPAPIPSLDCLEFDRMDHAIPWVERALMWIPILGWAASYDLWWRRMAPLVESIESQLRARPEPDAALWGYVPRRAEIGRYVCAVARDEMGWPNDHFVPDDRFDIVFWAHLDGLDAAAALQEIELHLDLGMENSEVDRWFKERATLGEVVDYLLALIDKQVGGSGPLQ
jgi:hypothetical protein